MSALTVATVERAALRLLVHRRAAAMVTELAPVTPQRPSALDWATRHALLRTAAGQVLRYADVRRDYQDQILTDPADRIIIAKSRQIGISQTVAFLAAHEVRYGGTVLWISRTGEQATMALDYVYLALDADSARPDYVLRNQRSCELANGGRCISQPATAGAGRGIPATLVIIDEQAWQQYARDIYIAVVPTLATSGGRLIVLSTPNGRANLFAELWQAAQEETSGWSAHYLPWSVHPDWDAEWAEARRDELGDEAFAQEHDVDFLVSGAARFDTEDIAALWRMPGFVPPEPEHRYVTAWDIARRRDAFVGFTFDVSTSPFRVVAYERHLRLDYPAQASAIEARHRAYPGRTVVESNGVGDPLIQFLTVRVEEFQTTALSKRNALDALKLLLQRRELISPRIVEWERELTVYQDADAQLQQDTVMASAIAALHAGRPVRMVTPINLPGFGVAGGLALRSRDRATRRRR